MKAMTGLVFFADGRTVQVDPHNQFPYAVFFYWWRYRREQRTIPAVSRLCLS
jgi:hypothetical protein